MHYKSFGAIEKLADSMPEPLAYQRDIIKALLNWARSQEISEGHFTSVLASLNGLIVGVLASDGQSMEQGLFHVTSQIRAFAGIAQQAKQEAIAEAQRKG